MAERRTPTAEMADELREAEEVMGILDQHAIAMGPALSRAYSRMYNELLKLRDAELKDWNEDASCGLHDQRRMLYRRDEASSPYHSPEEGPCEVYTPNWNASKGDGAVSLCNTCAANRAKAVA